MNDPRKMVSSPAVIPVTISMSVIKLLFRLLNPVRSRPIVVFVRKEEVVLEYRLGNEVTQLIHFFKNGFVDNIL